MPQDDNPIIDVILADINAVIPNFSSLVSSYRLLVGAAEEIQRTPRVPAEIFQRAVLRYDRAGTLIDVLLELLCCKIIFASRFLGTVCAPIDLARYAANSSDAADTPQRTAEQILLIELLRLILSSAGEESPCFGPPPPGIGYPQQTAKPPAGEPDGTESEDVQDLLSEVAPTIITDITGSPAVPRSQENERIRRKHYQKGAAINKKSKNN
ncbi:MAG: hypothetical protein N2491_00700 [Negativicutes bacterium]|nr:hypothetical protein [Negativicutes bacterium]